MISKKSIFNILKFLLFAGFGVLLVWLSVSGLNDSEWEEMKNVANNINYFWLGVSVVLVMLSHISRAMRWQMLIEPISHKPRFSSTFFSLIVGYFVNLAVPRLGEVTRTGLVSRYENIAIEKVLGTIVTDRAIDVFILLCITALAIILQIDVLGSYANETLLIPFWEKIKVIGQLNPWYVLGWVGFKVLTIFALGFIIKRFPFFKKITDWLSGIWTKIKVLFWNVWEGVISVKNVKNPLLFIFHSIFIWVMYFMMIYVCFLALPVTSNLGILVAMGVLGFGTFGFIVTPGGVGTYPLVVAGFLGLFGIEYATAYGFGSIIWLVQTVTIIIAGFISIIALSMIKERVISAEKTNFSDEKVEEVMVG